MKTKRLCFGLNTKINQSGIDLPEETTKDEIINYLNENYPKDGRMWREAEIGKIYYAHFNNGQWTFKY